MIVSSTLEPSRVVGLLAGRITRKELCIIFASVMLVKDESINRA
jgi:hypothetical protein